MNKVRIAIIGLGDMGTGHLKGFDALEKAEIVAICDSNKSAAECAAGQINNNMPSIYNDHLVMLDREEIDGVVIAVPGYLHEKIAEDCIKYKKDILMEKPVTISHEGYKKIMELCEKNNTIMQVGLVYRYSHLYRSIAQKLNEQKVLGNVMMAWCKEFRQCFPPEDWFYDEKKSGGTIVEKDCHHFDIFNWMIGSKPVKVFASGGQHVYRNGKNCLIDCSYSRSRPKVINEISVVDHAFVTIEYENGARANLGLCMYLKPMNISGDGLEIGFIGDNGKQLIARRDEMFGIYGGEFEDKIEYEIDTVKDNGGYGHIGCQKQRLEFMDCISTRAKPFASLDRTQDSLLIALAAEKSIKEGRIVSLDEYTIE